jgi:ATP-dependent Clp protease ATP-binding subunit ClpA
MMVQEAINVSSSTKPVEDPGIAMAEPTPVDRTRVSPVWPVSVPDRDPLRSLPPSPLTSFIGRDREVGAVADQMRRPDVHLITLTGPGGVGKTRLALQVAEALKADFGGVTWIDLAPLDDPALVAPAVAAAVGVPDAG